MRLKHLLLAVLAFMIIIPVNAQLRRPYRTDTYSLTRLQFPTENPADKARYVEVTIKRQALLGGGSDSGGGGSALGRFVDDEAGAISDREVSGGTRILIPDVFPADGSYYLEVLVSAEERAQNLELEEILFEPEAHTGNNSIGAKVEFRLHGKAAGQQTRQLLHSDGPYWIVGRGVGDMMAGAEAKDNSMIDLARRWALEEVINRYGLRFARIDVPVYVVRGLDRSERSVASDKQDELGELIESFNRQHRNEEYQIRVRENLAYWQEMLSRHQPGDDGPVNDDNVWTVHNNLAVAYFLSGNSEQAHYHIDKAIGMNFIEWRESTNRNGEVIGLSRVGVYDEESIASLHIFKRMLDSYFPGIEVMNPAFIHFLADREARESASTAAREWGINMFLSQMIPDLDVPVEFVSLNLGLEQPKEVKGTITKNGNKIADYTIKKTILFPLTNSYRIKIKTPDGTISTNQKNASVMLPSTNRDTYFNLVTRIRTDDIKTNTKAKWQGNQGINVMYDFDGNIVIQNSALKDRWWYREGAFFGFGAQTVKEDALGYTGTLYKFALEDDFSVSTIDFNSTKILRDRESGFGYAIKAAVDKMGPAWGDPHILETTLLLEEKNAGTINFSDSEMTVTSNGETIRKNIEKQKDGNGNWTNMTIGDIKITRTIEY